MTARWVLVAILLVSNSAPVIRHIPAPLIPHLDRIRSEPVFAAWLMRNPWTQQPLTDFINDKDEDEAVRKRAWQARQKFR